MSHLKRQILVEKCQFIEREGESYLLKKLQICLEFQLDL